MVDARKYQSFLDDYLAQMERVVEEFEAELEKQTAALKEMAAAREAAGGVEAKEQRPHVQRSDRRATRGPGIFNE